MKGSLHICDHCSGVRMTYGNVIVTFTMEEFHRFRRFIDEIAVEWTSQHVIPQDQCIRVAVTRGRVSLLLDYDELLELRALLHNGTGQLLRPLPEPSLTPSVWPEYLLN